MVSPLPLTKHNQVMASYSFSEETSEKLNPLLEFPKDLMIYIFSLLFTYEIPSICLTCKQWRVWGLELLASRYQKKNHHSDATFILDLFLKKQTQFWEKQNHTIAIKLGKSLNSETRNLIAGALLIKGEREAKNDLFIKAVCLTDPCSHCMDKIFSVYQERNGSPYLMCKSLLRDLLLFFPFIQLESSNPHMQAFVHQSMMKCRLLIETNLSMFHSKFIELLFKIDQANIVIDKKVLSGILDLYLRHQAHSEILFNLAKKIQLEGIEEMEKESRQSSLYFYGVD